MTGWTMSGRIAFMGLVVSMCGAAIASSPPRTPGLPGGPFDLKSEPEHLPRPEEAVGFPTDWTTIYRSATHNASMESAPEDGSAVRWRFAEARAWPLDQPSYDADVIGAQSAETTAAQWQGNAVGVSVARGMVFAASDDQFIYALNARTGALIWRASPIGSTYMGQPIIHDDLVYVNAGTVGFNYSNVQRYATSGTAVRGAGVAYNGIYALDRETGRLIWKFDTVGDAMPTPAWHDDRLVMSDGAGEVISLDAKSGTQIWKTTVGGMGNMSSPAIENGTIYVGMASPAYLYAIDERSGQVRWRASIPHAINTGMGDVSPAVADGVVVTDAVSRVVPENRATKAGTTAVLEKPLERMRVTVAAFDAKDGRPLWSVVTEPGPRPPSFKGGVPMIHGDVVYVGNPVTNSYQAFDLHSGRLLWTWRIPDPSEAGSGRGPATFYRGRLYIATGPALYVLDPMSGRLLAEDKIGGRFGITGPTIVNDTIYLGNSSDWVMAVPIAELNGSHLVGSRRDPRSH